MGQTIVILNDAEVATELLGKRSAVHSSRPNLVMASELSVIALALDRKDKVRNTDISWMIINRVGWKHILAMQTYSDRFRAYRKALQPYMGSESAVAQFNSLQEVEVHRFLLRVLKDQTKLAHHIQT